MHLIQINARTRTAEMVRMLFLRNHAHHRDTLPGSGLSTSMPLFSLIYTTTPSCMAILDLNQNSGTHFLKKCASPGIYGVITRYCGVLSLENGPFISIVIVDPPKNEKFANLMQGGGETP